MDFKVGDKIKLKINDLDNPNPNGKRTFDSIILAHEKPDYYMCILPRSSYLLTEDDVKFITVTDKANYESVDNLSAYLGKPRFWYSQRSLSQYCVSIDHSTPSGMSCADKYCKEYNMYALPNMPDGTYKCFSCRNRV